MIIGLLGPADEPQIQHMRDALFSAKHHALVIDSALFAIQWHLSFDPSRNDGILHFPEQSLAMSSIASVYWHKFTRSNHAQTLHDEREQLSLINTWLSYTQTHWVNSLQAMRSHQCKPVQLALASKLGASIPETYIGNCAAIAEQFVTCNNSTIVKPVHGGCTTRLVDTNHSDNQWYRPKTLQTFIAGTNIRSYVFEREVCHIQIDTQSIDFRDDASVTPEKAKGTPELDELCIRLCKQFAMQWCAIDWRLTDSGEYVFLEANPAPYFMYAEQCTGWDLTGRLLKQLLTPTS